MIGVRITISTEKGLSWLVARGVLNDSSETDTRIKSFDYVLLTCVAQCHSADSAIRRSHSAWKRRNCFRSPSRDNNETKIAIICKISLRITLEFFQSASPLLELTQLYNTNKNNILLTWLPSRQINILLYGNTWFQSLFLQRLRPN